jgi:hypothetical protein
MILRPEFIEGPHTRRTRGFDKLSPNGFFGTDELTEAAHQSESANVSRTFLRFHAHGLIARIPPICAAIPALLVLDWFPIPSPRFRLWIGQRRTFQPRPIAT